MDSKTWIKKYVSELTKQIEPLGVLSSDAVTSLIVIINYLMHRASFWFVENSLTIDEFYSMMFTGEMLRRIREKQDILKLPQNRRKEPNPLLCSKNKSRVYMENANIMFISWSLPTKGVLFRLLCAYIEHTIAEIIYAAMIVSHKRNSMAITLKDICDAVSKDNELLYTLRFFPRDVEKYAF